MEKQIAGVETFCCISVPYFLYDMKHENKTESWTTVPLTERSQERHVGGRQHI
jgi:hypothetical protein